MSTPQASLRPLSLANLSRPTTSSLEPSKRSKTVRDADPGCQVVAGTRAQGARAADHHVVEVARPEQRVDALVEFIRAVANLAGSVRHAGDDGSAGAGSADNQPAARPLAGGGDVDGYAGIWVPNSANVGCASVCTHEAHDSILEVRARLELADTAAGQLPNDFVLAATLTVQTEAGSVSSASGSPSSNGG